MQPRALRNETSLSRTLARTGPFLSRPVRMMIWRLSLGTSCEASNAFRIRFRNTWVTDPPGLHPRIGWHANACSNSQTPKPPPCAAKHWYSCGLGSRSSPEPTSADGSSGGSDERVASLNCVGAFKPALNKGEARNALARAVFFNRLGELRDRTYENQQHRTNGLSLVVEHINLTGDYVWRPDGGVRNSHLRPLRLKPQRFAP